MNWMSLSIRHKALMLVLIPLLFATSFVLGLRLMLENARSQAEALARSRSVIESANNLAKTSFNAGAALYMYSLSRNPEMQARYDESVDALKTSFEKLKNAAPKQGPEATLVSKMQTLISRVYQLLAETEQSISENQRLDELAELGESRLELQSLLRRLISASSKLQELEQARHPKKSFDQKKFEQIFDLVLYSGLLLNALIAAFLSILFTRSIIRRIEILADNAGRVVQQKELNPRLSGSDEIALLDGVFHKMVADLTEAEKLKQAFIAIISHELRSPLQVIKTSLKLAINGHYGALSESGTRSMSAAERNVGRLIGLVNEILDAEKLQSGTIAVDISPCDLRTIAESAIASFETQAQEQEIKLILKAPVSVPMELDQLRMEQVLINLLSNAFKFAPSNSDLELRIEDNESSVLVSVIDQGPGIAPEQSKRIFEKFYQIKDDTTKNKGGTGLGLSICKAIIQAHQSEIRVKSTLGKGCCFYFELRRELD